MYSVMEMRIMRFFTHFFGLWMGFIEDVACGLLYIERRAARFDVRKRRRQWLLYTMAERVGDKPYRWGGVWTLETDHPPVY